MPAVHGLTIPATPPHPKPHTEQKCGSGLAREGCLPVTENTP